MHRAGVSRRLPPFRSGIPFHTIPSQLRFPLVLTSMSDQSAPHPHASPFQTEPASQLDSSHLTPADLTCPRHAVSGHRSKPHRSTSTRSSLPNRARSFQARCPNRPLSIQALSPQPVRALPDQPEPPQPAIPHLPASALAEPADHSDPPLVTSADQIGSALFQPGRRTDPLPIIPRQRAISYRTRPLPPPPFFGVMSELSTCPKCGGSGELVRTWGIERHYTCSRCGFWWVEYSVTAPRRRCRRIRRTLIKIHC